MSWGTGSAEVDVLSSQLLDPEDRLPSGKWKHPSQLWAPTMSHIVTPLLKYLPIDLCSSAYEAAFPKA